MKCLNYYGIRGVDESGYWNIGTRLYSVVPLTYHNLYKENPA